MPHGCPASARWYTDANGQACEERKRHGGHVPRSEGPVREGAHRGASPLSSLGGAAQRRPRGHEEGRRRRDGVRVRPVLQRRRSRTCRANAKVSLVVLGRRGRLPAARHGALRGRRRRVRRAEEVGRRRLRRHGRAHPAPRAAASCTWTPCTRRRRASTPASVWPRSGGALRLGCRCRTKGPVPRCFRGRGVRHGMVPPAALRAGLAARGQGRAAGRGRPTWRRPPGACPCAWLRRGRRRRGGTGRRKIRRAARALCRCSR